MTIQPLDGKVQISPYQTYEEPILLLAEIDLRNMKYINGNSDSHFESFSGKDGNLYRISDSECVKIPHGRHRGIGREMMIARMLHAAGISVPKLFAWDYIKQNTLIEPKKGFIMEYVPGKTGYWLPEEENNQAFKRAEKEFRRAQKMGFGSRDWWAKGNYILTPSDKIVLIDFADWSHPDVPDFIDPESVFKEAA